LTLSAIQYTALDGGLAANVPEHIRLIEDAESHGARLVIFPELSLTGYGREGLEEPGSWVTGGDGRLDGLREICRRTGITAVVGAPAREADGTPRLATLALHPNGGLDSGFRAWRYGREQPSVSVGGQPVMLDLDGWRIAVAGWPDIARLDLSRPGLGFLNIVSPAEGGPDKVGPAAVHAGPGSPAEARAGADICAVPALCTAGTDQPPAVHPGALARDNRMFSLLANLGGTTDFGPSAGGSGVWGPDGLVIRQAAGTGTEVLTVTLEYGVLDRPAARRAAPEPPGRGVLPAGPA
ncbi:MAG TPA: carbon-nitrogen hydrolase family protein, partial [Arthrobacter sp.]|nr:carbon-nitrogen hydrolase family protein [Arthrobacter sp.]